VLQEIASISAHNSCVVLLKQQFAAHKQGAAWDGALKTIERVRRTDDAHSLKLFYDLYEARNKGLPGKSAAGRLERRLCAADEIVATKREVRKFHQASNLQTYKWDKGGRLYSYPQASECYQHLSEDTRLGMRIDGESVVEIDISSSYLTIFYAWCDQRLDTDADAYSGILGPTDLDRQVAKFWINASFGNGNLLTRWAKEFTSDFRDRLKKKGIPPEAFDTKAYPMSLVKERALQRHPLLERWGGEIRGRVRGWADLMFVESKVIIATMQELMAKGVPSMPVHDSLIVQASKEALAADTLSHQFRAHTGVVPKLDVSRPGF
jgi:hypothetical protein